ncbi:GPI-anchored surface protein, putative [Bodo saltans]|uniref:GPI-anchored surface protein, putative n=1 Tax=Bodo saltans TaxID=75058 RepID=A0A0S4J7J2_BODSA|nr:GPI-anchored surface protein, putative [Bodo saltans]|eukprot:CUG87458.1 GPI-anchored surface protein, putative [Bodo saltans]
MMFLLLTLLCLATMCSSTAIYTPIAIPTALKNTTQGGAQGLAVTSNGRYMVITDTMNQCIRVLDMNSPASWLATIGNGTKSYGDGLNSTSLVAFNNPSGVAVLENSLGSPQTILVADTSNSCIRAITWSTWNVSTIAGNATAALGNVDGIASSARFSAPRGIALVGNDTLYIADNGNGNIRRLILSTKNVTFVVRFDSNYPGSPVNITVAPGASSDDLVLWVSFSNSALNKIAVGRLHIVNSNVITTTISNYSGGAGIVARPRNGRYWVYAGSSSVTGVVAVLNKDASTALNNTGIINVTARFTTFAINSSSNTILAISGQQVGYLSGFTLPPQTFTSSSLTSSVSGSSTVTYEVSQSSSKPTVSRSSSSSSMIFTSTSTGSSSISGPTASISLTSTTSESSTSTLTGDTSQSSSKPILSPSPSTTLRTSIFTSPVVWATTPSNTVSIVSPSVTPSLSASQSNSSLRGEAFVQPIPSHTHRYTHTSASSSSSPTTLTSSPTYVTSSQILYTSTTATIPVSINVYDGFE